MRIALLTSFALLSLSACALFGGERGGGPDASQVRTYPPLVIPADLTRLPPPQ